MTTKTDNASTFKIVTGIIAIFLVIAAALVYLQKSGDGSSAAELAALSQAVPSQAARALGGEPGAYAELDNSVRRLASLRQGGSPGSAADWQQLESAAQAVLARRESVESVAASARQLDSGAQALLDGQPVKAVTIENGYAVPLVSDWNDDMAGEIRSLGPLRLET